MLNAVLEHVPIKLESFDDDDELSECSAWKASTTSRETADPTTTQLTRATTTSRASSTSSRTAQLDDEIESCGNVFTLNRRKLFLICGYCDGKYANMLQFAKHLNDRHKTFSTHDDDAISNQGVASEAESDCDAPAITGMFLKGELKLHFVRDGALADVNTIPTPPPSVDGTLLKHIPIKLEDNADDDVTMADDCSTTTSNFENNVESCGNIFVMNRRKLFLVCGFCEGKYANMELFSSHLQECHDHFQENDSGAEGCSTTKSVVQVPTIKLEPQDTHLPIKRRNTSNDGLLPMVAIPNGTSVDNEDIIPQKEIHRRPATIKETRALDDEESDNDDDVEEELDDDDDDDYQIDDDEDSDEDPSAVAYKKQVQTLASDSDFPTKAQDFSKESSPPKVWSCKYCKETFRKQTRMMEHSRIHTGEKPFKCEECGKAFRVKLRMTEHQLRHRSDKAFICEVCGLGCSTRQDYSLHQRHHTGDKRHPCPECGKGFVRSGDLRTHMRVHSGERPFKCETCGLMFRANQNLIIHRRVHQTDKQFQCDYCDKRFHRKIDKRVHHRTHTGEKAFKCEICGKGYSAKVHVRRHIQQQHMDPLNGISKKSAAKKCFKCDFCSKSYSAAVTLEKHVKQIHNRTSSSVEQAVAQPEPEPTDGGK